VSHNPAVRAARPLSANIDDRIRRLASAWAEDHDIAALYLFGSRARGRAVPCSDVDLAVVLREGLDADTRWRKRLDLVGAAARLLGTDAVDVVVLEDAPIVLGHRVLAHGRLLCEPVPRRRARVAERIMRQYLDEAHLRAVLDAGLTRRLSEGRFAR
jgi:hypothetical protein